MESVTFANQYDETITVSLLSDGRITVRHSELDEPGEFAPVGFSFRGQPTLGAINTSSEHYNLSRQETAQIRKAIQILSEAYDD